MSKSFDLNSFLAQLESDVPKEYSGDRVNKILMNVRDNQGTIIFVPFLSKVEGNFYTTLESVREWRGSNSQFPDKEVWYRILSKELYGELSTEESDLYDEVLGLFNSVHSYKHFSYDKLRFRNYTLMYGFLLSHTSGNNKLTSNIDKPCLFIFPSLTPIDALNTAIVGKREALKGNTAWITSILSPSDRGRKGVVSLTFKKSSGAGYTSAVQFEMNSEFEQVIDPEKIFPSDQVALFDSTVRDLLAWQGGPDSALFNFKVFEELKSDLQVTLKRLMDASKTDEPTEEITPQEESKPVDTKPVSSSDSVSDSAGEVKGTKNSLPF